jgi:AcrR family transcriptional regulator
MSAVPARRMTREESKALTRERLIAAARTTFARHGFHRASLEEIAAEAGYSTGAIYANFDGKEDLFLAVLDQHVADRLRSTERAVAGASTPGARARAGADDWMRFLREDPDWYPLFIEFWSYALRDPKLRREAAARFKVFPRASARLYEENAHALGVELPEGLAEAAGTLSVALADGLALMKVIDPDAVSDELFGDALEALVTFGLQAGEREG